MLPSGKKQNEFVDCLSIYRYANSCTHHLSIKTRKSVTKSVKILYY